MDTSYELTRNLERIAMERVGQYAIKFADDGKVYWHEGKELQKELGDMSFAYQGKTYCVELKAEQKFTGNLFLETWSNRSRWTIGWMYTTKADKLWYYFIDNDELYYANVETLRDWCFGSGDGAGQIYKHRELKQSKYAQKNDSWGRIVPIETLLMRKVLFGPRKLLNSDSYDCVTQGPTVHPEHVSARLAES